MLKKGLSVFDSPFLVRIETTNFHKETVKVVFRLFDSKSETIIYSS